LRQRSVGYLKKTDAVVGVVLGLHEGGNIGQEAGGNRKTGCVVGARVDL